LCLLLVMSLYNFPEIFFFPNGLHAYKAGALPLEPHQQCILVWLFLEMGGLVNICLGWPWTLILLKSAYQVSRITSVSHWYLARGFFFLKTGSCCIAQVGLKYLNLLPQSPEYWNYRHIPLHPVYGLTFFFLQYCNLNSGPTPWATVPVLFFIVFFEMHSHELFAQAGFEPWSSWSLLPE
jgi:hypothetical protein